MLDNMNSEEKESKEEDLVEVTFDGEDDEEDARRLSKLHKWFIVVIIALGSTCVTCLSSSWSLASENIQNRFHVGHEVSTLGISLYIWALGTGGVFLAPISEYYGRKITYIIGLALLIVFNFLPEFCNNFGGILYGRFMSGFFASSFMAVASGTFSDIFSKDELAYPVALYTMSPFVGPGLGPLISGFINENIDFRWTFHVMTIWAAMILALVILFVPETYQPVLLKYKARRLRKTHKSDKYYAPIESNEMTLFDSIILSSKRPVELLFKDKMTFILCFYTGFTLAIVYLFFVSVPYTFETIYGFSLDQVGLSFVGLIIGMIIASSIAPHFVDKRIIYLTEQNNGVAEPEFRFFSLKIGVFIVPAGLFIMGWTSYTHVHWVAPIIGSGVYGIGTILVFNGIFGYTVDAYRLYAASAMATNSFIRSIMAGVFPLFGLQMYKGMNVHWANTLLALFACGLIPVAFLFAKYGKRLREQSPYAWV